MRHPVQNVLLAGAGAVLLLGAGPLGPALAQPTVAAQRLSDMMAEAVRANVDHIFAAGRCDQAGMDAAAARLNELAVESRRIDQAAQAAGQFADVDPRVSRAITQNIASLRDQARARRARCEPRTERPRDVGFAVRDERAVAAILQAEDQFEAGLLRYEDAVSRCDDAAMREADDQIGAGLAILFAADRRGLLAPGRFDQVRQQLEDRVSAALQGRSCPPAEQQPIVQEPAQVGTTGPAPQPEDSILDEITPPRDLLGRTADQELAPQAGPPAAPRPTVDRSALIGLRAALERADNACDSPAFERARQRLLVALDALIAAETDEARISGLVRERDEARVRAMRPCPPPAVIPLPGPVGAVPPGPAFGINFGIGQADIPLTGIGVQRAGPPGATPEEFGGRSLGKIDFIEVGGFLDFNAAGTGVRVGISYGEGDGGSSFTVPSGGGIDSGIVYGAPAPSGSSGVIAPFGLSGEISSEYSELSLLISARMFSAISPPRRVHSIFSSSIFVNYTNRELLTFGDAVGSGRLSNFDFEFGQDREQRVRDNMIEAGANFQALRAVANRISLRAEGSAGVYHHRSRLRSVERNTSNFGPSSDRDFTIEINERDSGIGFHGFIAPGVELQVSRNVALNFGGAVDYRSRVGAIFNPNSGDQVFFEGLTTALDADDAWSWRAVAGVTVRFGR